MCRIPIPQGMADELLVSCNHSCCICHEFGVIIHHIDGNPANNDPDNLIPLCPTCHGRVSPTYPLTRGFTPEQLRRYRGNWTEQCRLALTQVPQIQMTATEREELQNKVQSLENRVSELERAAQQ